MSGPLSISLLGFWSRWMVVDVLRIAQSLLWINIAMLLLDSFRVVDMSVPWLDFGGEDLLDFLEGLSGSLRPLV